MTLCPDFAAAGANLINVVLRRMKSIWNGDTKVATRSQELKAVSRRNFAFFAGQVFPNMFGKNRVN